MTIAQILDYDLFLTEHLMSGSSSELALSYNPRRPRQIPCGNELQKTKNGEVQRHPSTAQWYDHVLIYMVRKLHANILAGPSHRLTLFLFHPSFLLS